MSPFEPQSAADVLENLADAIAAFDRDWRFTYLNRRAELHYRKSRHELIGQVLWEVFPNAQGSTLQKHLLTAAAAGTRIEFRVESLISSRLVQVRAEPGPEGMYLFFRDVTEQAWLEAEQGRRFLDMADALPVLISYVDAEQRYQFNNRTYETWFGVHREQIHGRHVREILGEAAYRMILPSIHEALGGREVRRETTVDYPVAGHRTVQVFFKPHRGADGRVLGFYALVSDLTERRRAEAALQESEERFRQAVDEAPIPMLIHDAQGKVLHVNRAWTDASGFGSSEISSLDAWLELAGADLPPHSTDLEAGKTSVDGFMSGMEVVVRTKSGQSRIWICTSAPLGRMTDGHQTVVTMAVDVTERQRVEEQLRANERRKTFLLALGDRIRPLTDPIAVTANAAAALGRHLKAARVGYAEVAMPLPIVTIHRDWTDGRMRSLAGVTRPLDVFGPKVVEALTGGQILRVDDIRADPDIAPHAEHYAAIEVRSFLSLPLIKGGALRAIMFVHEPGPRAWTDEDVALTSEVAERTWAAAERARAETERLALLEAERAARAEAERLNRTKDEFLATLSHELRTPLNPALLIATDSAKRPDYPPAAREDFRTIARQVALESRLIDDMLDLTRIGRGLLKLDRQTVDVHTILRDALGTVECEIARKGLHCEFRPEASSRHVLGDAVRLQQVFWNLLNNAVKFTPAGGSIRVVTGNRDDQIEIEISDSGRGLTAEELNRAFDPFEQGSHDLGGLGLGLAITRRLVDLHDGTICGNSGGRDQGASFIVRLALTRPQRPSRPAPSDPPGFVRDRSLAVLVVEDHASSRIAIERLLRGRGYSVVAVGTAAAAERAARENSFDLILSDIGLPDGNGYELLERLREHLSCPAIAMTGYGMDDDVQRARDAGYALHLVKPVTVDRLDRALSAATAAGDPV